MIKEIEITCPPGQQGDEAVLKSLAAKALQLSPQKISSYNLGNQLIASLISRFIEFEFSSIFMEYYSLSGKFAYV